MSSDEEEDLARLEIVEQKLLNHDPTFSYDHTYQSLSQKRSALIQAFRPQYEEGDVEGGFTINYIKAFLRFHFPCRQYTDPLKHREMADV